MSKPRNKSKASRFLGGLLYAAFAGSALAFGTVAGWLNQTPESKALVAAAITRRAPEKVFEKESVTLLLLGCDEDRYYGGKQVLRNRARADMILVAKLDFKNKRITGVSIPRDTECQLPGYRTHKINAYYALGKSEDESEELMKSAVEYTLDGVKIDRVVTLDYEAFQQAIDMIGGVIVDIPFAMKYDDNAGGLHVDLEPGPRKLDGYQAMGFVRYRKGERGYKTLSDFDRQENQKKLLLSFKQQSLQNWSLLPKLATQGRAVLDNALSEDEIASLAFFAKDLPTTGIQMGQIPVIERRGSTNLRVDEQKLGDVLIEFGLRENPYTVAVTR